LKEDLKGNTLGKPDCGENPLLFFFDKLRCNEKQNMDSRNIEPLLLKK
jgi:hypothetical protein